MRYSEGSHEKPVVLVVDDQERNIQVVGSTLVGAGYEIIPATSGEQALRRVEARKPDLILLDILMPGMDGVEVCRQLQSRPETTEIPIIFLSAADEKNIIVGALEAGGVDYVTKPFNKAELLLRVRHHVELKDARDRLRELLALREEFIGILAHDLKNPLTGVRFCAQLLLEKREELPPQLQKLTGNIVEAANQMFEFIDQFLVDRASESGSISVDLQPVEVKEACKAALGRHQLTAARKGIGLDFDAPAETVYARADPKAMGQVLDNLLSNAIKFSPKDTAVRVTVTGDDGESPRIIVKDEGPGFTEADRDKLWQRFTRLSARPTGGETSTGLGLSIVKRLVEMMGGSISLESAPGEGATFAIELNPA